VRRSLLTPERPLLTSGEVLLVDTLGEMLRLYAAADLVFVGGSLVATGGHNILEAALVRRPVLFGPHMQNFREIAALVEHQGGGRMVADGDELFAAVDALLDQPELARQQGEKGHALIGTHAGATQRTVAALRSLGC
jgi:3-deoxy-D-manno-octulosonic-acid transferase